jgi:GNAT superfamily N-acetyltransferase
MSKNAKIEYRWAETADFQTLIGLKGKMEKRERAAEEWVARWPWQFMQHPWRPADMSSNFVVALLDGRIAGGIGSIPTVLEFGGESIESAFGCELFVDPSAQGHGLGQALIDRVVERYPYSLWMNTPAAGARSYAKRGFTGVEPVNYMMLPVNPGHVLKSRGHRVLGALAGWTGGPASAVIRMRLRSFSLPHGAALCEVTEFGEEFDHFCTANLRPDIVRPRRNAAFLRWRYLDCPFGPYRVLASRSASDLNGYVVYRTKPSHNGILGIVNELEADAGVPGLAEALLAAATRSLLDMKADLITSLPTDAHTREVFRRAGFLDARRTPYVYVAPGGAEELGLPTEGARWRMSMGDCDVDFF